MSTRGRPTRQPLIVLAGEDSNDRKAFRILLEAFCPDAQGRIVEVNDVIRFCRAGDVALQERARKLAGSIRARAARERAEIACVFVHEDFDAVDSPYRNIVRRRVEEALRRNIGCTHYILATWEIEAWLLLFPDALSAFASSWALPSRYRRVDTGRIADPKRVMKHEVSKSGPQYRVSDSPKIFERAVTLGLHELPASENRSYRDFVESTAACCRSLLKGRESS